MYGELVLFDESGKPEKGERKFLGEVKGKDEAWLRDLLFDHPGIIPADEIDPTFGPLVPLCRELRTDVGSIDAAFINTLGRLTIVECKLWKNPQARREVVAQTLDYVSALSAWTYADLQRQVANAVGRQGNIPFELVRKSVDGSLREQDFVDAVSRSLREGRFLVLLAGDGIREGVQSLTELVNRNASKAFTFGLVEFALYTFAGNRFAIQPRVLAETEAVPRQFTVVKLRGELDTVEIVDDEQDGLGDKSDGASVGREHLKRWWAPVLQMRFDDPEQEAPRWLPPNNAVLTTPYPGIQIKAWAKVDGKVQGVFVTGPRAENLEAILKFVRRDRRYLIEQLPDGTEVDVRNVYPIMLKNEERLSDPERYAWLKKALNDFVNVLRPRLKKWYEETRA
jgi:hypothetical protein